MNIKFNKLTLIGKIWTIREMIDKGIYEHNKDYIKAGVKKLEEIIANEEYLNTNSTLCEGTQDIENIVEHARLLKEFYVDKQYVLIGFEKRSNAVSKLWVIREKFDYLKHRARYFGLDENDFKDIHVLIYKIQNLSNCNKFTSNERIELNKIMWEVENFKFKCENKFKITID